MWGAARVKNPTYVLHKNKPMNLYYETAEIGIDWDALVQTLRKFLHKGQCHFVHKI